MHAMMNSAPNKSSCMIRCAYKKNDWCNHSRKISSCLNMTVSYDGTTDINSKNGICAYYD